eukprot:gnl/Spiro4/26214_TR13067_c0_g1_i1.p1 gnl/Spiro4/26214_TR13067_c0_g1~~gnl/Spiro4/26214_TR13067_c0_g1_i1.p1  ORF type:complete len:271 (-),score=53.21 gnl/Spiro4/26214_TR13067_c0_g1_i1:6-794(-)
METTIIDVDRLLNLLSLDVLVLDIQADPDFEAAHLPCASQFRADLNPPYVDHRSEVVVYGSDSVDVNSPIIAVEIPRLLMRYFPAARLAVVAGGVRAIREFSPFLLSDSEFSEEVSWPNIVTRTPFPLYLSGALFADNQEVLRALSIKRIVNASNNEQRNCAGDLGISYMNVAVADSLDADLLSVLDGVLEFLLQAPHTPTLVHCSQGISRSAAIVIAFLMRVHGWPLAQALSHVRACRPIIRPNESFVQQLQQFEAKLHDS